MAEDYNEAYKKFVAGGGKDINEFLQKHVVKRDDATNTALSVAERIAAADRLKRLTSGGRVFESNTVTPGNVLTQRVAELDSPPGTEGTYINGPLANPKPQPSPTPGAQNIAQAETDSPPGVDGTYYNGPLANPKPSPTPSGNLPERKMAPTFQVAQNGQAQQQQQNPGQPAWWQRTAGFGDLGNSFAASSFSPEFQAFIDRNAEERAARGTLYQAGASSPAAGGGFIRLNRNTYIPQSVNYNVNSTV